jgi:integrase/recombinase XerD
MHDDEKVYSGELVWPTTTPNPGTVVVPEPDFLTTLRGKWLLSFQSPNTRAAYARDFDAFRDWCDEFGFDVLDARRSTIDAYTTYLTNGGAGRVYSNASRARKLAALSSFYRYGMEEDEDRVTRNPLATVRRPKHQPSDTPWLDVTELQRLFAAADAAGPRDAALVRMLYYSAVRVSELCNATTADLRRVDGTLTLAVIRKGSTRERVAIGKPAADALARHLGRRTGPLFLLRGQPVDRNQVAYAITRIARTAGLGDKKLTPHGLRHSAATHALMDGESPVRVQQMLGHSRIETTMAYSHVASKVSESPTHRLAQIVEGQPA